MKRLAFLFFLLAFGVANAATDGEISSQIFVVKETKTNGSSTVSISKPALAASYSLVLPDDDGVADQVLRTDGSGNLSWTAAATAPATSGSVFSNGTTLSATAWATNGDKLLSVTTAATGQEFRSLAVGTSGTDFAVAFGSGTITLNLPDASASNRGVVTTGAQTFAGDKTFSGLILGSAGTAAAPSLSFSGDPDTGFFSAGANSIGFAHAGILAATLSSTAQFNVFRAAGSGALILSRASNTVASPSAVATDESIGGLYFQGYDGNSYENAAAIEALVDGAVADGDMNGRLAFKTTATGSTTPTERLRIDATGLSSFFKPILVDGSGNEVQLTVQANGTQSASSLVVEESDGDDIFSVTVTSATGATTVKTHSTVNGQNAQYQASGIWGGSTAQIWSFGLNIANTDGSFDIYDNTAGAVALFIDKNRDLNIKGDGTHSRLRLYEGATENWRIQSNGTSNDLSFTYQPSTQPALTMMQEGGVLFSVTAGGAGLYTVGNAADATTCSTHCANGDSGKGFDADSGICLGAWNAATGANLASGCAATDNVSKYCLCAGAAL